MNLFRKRPFAAIIGIGMLTAAPAAVLPWYCDILLLLLIAVAAPVAIGVLRRREINSICNLRASAFAVFTSALSLCMVLTSFAYFDVYAARCEDLHDARIEAMVIKVNNETSYSSIYTVRLRSHDGKSINGKGLIYADTALSLTPGDIFEADAIFCPLDEFYEYSDTTKLEMLSKGHVFTCDISGVTLLGRDNTPEVMLARLNKALASKLSLFLTRETAELSEALLLGNRDGLGKIYRDFKYTGAVHILALSGMHLAMICGGLEKLLSALRMGKIPRYAISAAWLVFYVSLTGFLMSVMRAAIMLLISYICSLTRFRDDRVTSLFISVCIIIFVDPAAMFDVSLQLSFAATLGVSLMSGAASDATKKHASMPFRIIYRSGESVAASLGAALFILPLQWLYFGELSLVCIPATIVLSGVCSGMLLLLPPYLLTCLMGLELLGGRLAFIIEHLAKLMCGISSAMASIAEPVSIRYPFTLPIMILCAAAIVWMSVKGVKNPLYSLIPCAAACVVFLCLVGIYNAVNADTVRVKYESTVSGDGFVATFGNDAMLIDVGGGSVRVLRALDKRLDDSYITSVDTLMLTTLSRRHVNAVRGYLSECYVSRILAPIPSDEYNVYLTDELRRCADEYGTDLTLYDPDKEFSVSLGDLTVTVPGRTTVSRSIKPLTLISFTNGGDKLTYAGTAAWESPYIWAYAKDARYLIIGEGGPKLKSPPEGSVGSDTAVVCIPSQELREALSPWLGGYTGKVIIKPSLDVKLGG